MRTTGLLFLSLLPALVCAGSYGTQAHLGWEFGREQGFSEVEGAKWNLQEGPAQNATWNLLFDTASSLMQRWANTRYRNGHTIIPGTIAPGTILSHGTRLNSTPQTPEWAAVDPEHSYIFCRGSNATGCGHATFAATRPLKVLYFDGSSAAKMANGEFDTQDVVQFGAIISTNWTYASEYERIDYFCSWGKPFGIDGYVRMQMDFEVILCSFTDGVDLVSFDTLVPFLPLRMTPTPTPAVSGVVQPVPSSERARCAHIPPYFPRNIYEVVFAAHWSNRYPGDTRLRLDYTRMVSFYDTDLAPSLVAVREGKERWDYRLKGISRDDIQAARQRLEAALVDPSPGSGVDWDALMHVVVDRYADRLELIRHVLNASEARTAHEMAKTVQTQLRVILTPYILNSVRPPNGSADPPHSWASPVFKRCATMHMAQIAKPPLSDRLTYSERVLLRGVQETSREICRVMTNMWAEGAVHGLDEHFPGNELEETQLKVVLFDWRDELGSLMGWLDWSVWVKCRPACSDEEECYLSTWPFFNLAYDPGWERPHPRCIRRIEPFNRGWP